MSQRLSQIWQQFQQLFSLPESLDTTIETGQAVLVAAKTLKEHDASVKVLKSVLQNSSSLLDVLCLPIAQVVGADLPFRAIGLALLKFARNIDQQELSLEDCVFIISQVAYLESTEEILNIYGHVNWDAKSYSTDVVSKQLQKLNDIELDSENAIQVIKCFQTSPLAAAFNQVLLVRLATANISPSLAKLLTQRIAWNTHHYIIKALVEAGDVIKNLLHLDLRDWQREQQKFQSVDEYLKTNIATKPFELVFGEKFSFKDIYVPLKAQLVDEDSDSFNLETWVKTILFNPDNLDQVIFIQGDIGRGKSFFCRMFAYSVWRQLYPTWTPILIRLRDINTCASSFPDILKAELQFDFIQGDNNWLTNPNTRFLFILDGLDELPHNINLATFIQQVAEFQQECKNNPEMGHRVMITGRVIALQHIPELPDNLERVEIVPLNEQLQQQWLYKWAALSSNQGQDTNFTQFLPSHIKKLAQEPLFLYLLAAMYRDGKLSINKLGQAQDHDTAKIIIYQEAVNWLFTKSKVELNKYHASPDFTQFQLENYKYLLMEAAICVVHSGHEFASFPMLEARLQADETAAEKWLNQAGKTALTTLCICSRNTPDEGVKFFHQSFSEFLFAERLQTRLKAWTQYYYDSADGRQPIISETIMNREIYDLLGYGGLTREIVDYLMGLLIASQDFFWVELFKRLEKFYLQWSQGKFIDSADETLPQKKLRQLQKYGIKGLGQRQIDIYAGLNVMILLLELHRYAQKQDNLQEQIIFYPSGQPKENSWTEKLRLIINYSDSGQIENFHRVMRSFLRGVNLKGANLTDTDFSNVDLSNANLNGANLCGATLFQTCLQNADLSNAYIFQAYFGHANLSGANLSDSYLSHSDMSYTNLRYVNFSDADLSGADLSDTNFTGANLSNTDLSGANFSNANLSGANFSHANFSNNEWGDIHWNENTIWQDVQGLDTAKNVPDALTQQLRLTEET